MARPNRFWLILPLLAGILLISTMQTGGTNERTVLPEFPVGSGSWNPKVACPSTWIVRISDITDNRTGSASQASSVFNPGITSPFGTAKRWLTPGNPPHGWVSPGPSCTITNSHGVVSLFVEIDGVRRGDLDNSDCSSIYDPVNGAGPMGASYCDTDFNVYDPAIVPDYSTSCTSASDPTCYGRIHIEIDHDWKAAKYCGLSTACDDGALNQTTSSTIFDIQGFIYWDPDNVNQQWHSFSGWEIHAVTGWRLHQATSPNPPLGTYFDHLVVIMMENEGILDICGQNPPPCQGANSTYMSSLANNYGITQQYFSLNKTSPPNYAGLIGASTFGCGVSGCPTITSPNLVDRLEAAGLSWKAYMENQNATSGCVATTQLPYFPRHNPFVFFQDITNNTSRCNKIILANPSSCGSAVDCSLITDLNSSAPSNFIWLTPNICNDMHGNSTCTNGCTALGRTTCIADGDNYLKSLVPNILNSKTFTTTRAALFITFDEGNGYCPLISSSSEDCLYAVWAGPVAKTGSFFSSHLYNHYSFLKTVEVNWNLTSLTSNDASATPMTEFFASMPTNSIDASPGIYYDHLVVIMMENEGIREICGNSLPCNGSNSPYMSSLANTYGIGQQYTSLITTSEPNYYGILGASIFGCPTNCYPPAGGITAPNLVDRFEVAGLTWKGYMENQTPVAGCDGSTHEPYEHEHNGFTAFQDIYYNSTRCKKIVLANPALNSTCTVTDCSLIKDLNSTSAPNFMWLTPNDCDNMHANSVCTVKNGYNGCTSPGTSCITDGDNYLKSLVPNILNSYTFQNQRSALFIVFDEGSGTCPFNGSSEDCVYAVWAGPTVKTSFNSSHFYNQYSLTKTIEVNWNLTTLTSNDAAATAMTEFFKAPTSNFTVSANPTSLTSLAGARSNSTITLTSLNGFTGTVALTATSSPTGPMLTLNPSSVTLGSGGTSTSTLSVTSSTTGNYTVTVTGTSGSLTHSAPVFDTVQDYAITASPTIIKTNAGTSGTSTMTIIPINRFSGTVSLSATGTTGLTTSISPTTITAGSGTATLTVSSATAINYTATVTSTSSSLTHSVTVNVQVVDFTITATSPSPINIGSSATSTINVAAVNHFAGTVSLIDTLPSGLSCSTISPSTITGSGTATVSCSATVAGNYTLTVTGTSGSLGHSATATFQIQDFTISASSPAPVDAGVAATSTITVASLNHFSGTVAFSDTVPSGLTCGPITPSSVTGSGAAAVSCSATLAGNYTLTITGSSTSLVHGTTATFTIQDFTVAASSPAAVDAGVSVPSTITVTALNHFNGLVSLTDTVPGGLTCGGITPTTVTGSGTATVSCSATVAGNYTLTITGTSSPLVHSATATFMFQDFTIAASSPAAVDVGASATSAITVTALNSFAGVVSLADTVPAGLTCGAISPISVTGSGTATVSCSATLAGNYTLTVTGTSTPLVHTATATFRFQDFTIAAASPAEVSVGSSATSTIAVSPLNGFTGTVGLTDTVPSGLTCGVISPSSITGGSGTATVSCNATIAGNYTLTIKGTSTPLVHTTAVVFKFGDFAISATSPAAVDVTLSSTSIITVASINHFAATVTFTDTLPSGLTCGAFSPTSVTGSGTATISCTASAAGNYTLTVTGTSGSLAHSTTATFVFQDFTIAATSPAALNVNVSATSTITVAALNHFAGVVDLTDTVPSGLTCGAVTPTSVTGSGTATVSCSATVAGNYTLTITGTSTAPVHTATATFRFRDFTMSANPSTVTLVLGSGSSTLTVASLNGFTGTVFLTDTVSPSGPTCTLSPSSVTLGTSGTSTLSCSTTGTTSFTVTVTGSSGGLIHSVSVTFAFSDFAVSATSPTADAGHTATSTITVTALGVFAGTVSLTDTLPAGLTCSAISPSIVIVPPTATASLACSSTTATAYNVTISGTSGSTTHTTFAVFKLVDFTVSATSPAAVNVGQSATSTIAVTAVNGFTGTVALSDTVPSGLTCGAISPNNITGSGIVTLSCSSTTPNSFTVTISGTDGTNTHAATAAFNFQDFALTASNTSVTVNASLEGNSTITVTPLNGFTGSVTLGVTANSTNLSCTLTSTNIAGGSGTSILSCSGPVAGNFLASITGTSSGLSHSATVTYSVQDFAIAASPASITVNAGTATNSTIQITGLNGFAGIVGLATNSTWCTFAPTSITGSGNATVSCNQFAAGNYTVTITGTSDGLSHAAVIILTVQPGGSVGGVVLPTDKLRLLLDYIPTLSLVLVVLAIGVLGLWRSRRRRERRAFSSKWVAGSGPHLSLRYLRTAFAI